MNNYLIILITFFLFNCKKTDTLNYEYFFSIINIDKKDISMEIKSINYKNKFNINHLDDELKKESEHYFNLKPKVDHQILIKYNNKIESDYFVEIKNILEKFRKENIDKEKICQRLFQKGTKETTIEEREKIDKFYPRIIFYDNALN